MTTKPNHASATPGRAGLGVFVIKTLVVAVVISTSVIFVIDWLISDLHDLADSTINQVRAELKAAPVSGRPFWAKIEKGLDQAAEDSSELPAETKQKLLRDVHVIVARWRPFLDAVEEEMQKPPPAH
ncbi:MAG: hypothetical protein ABSG46_18685 [Candidatus Binataceae bacterium]